ncbi:MAG: CRISPR system precrRNA processing endoribonuclease RAMP protein Cas6 [Anaerolineae bacterium]
MQTETVSSSIFADFKVYRFVFVNRVTTTIKMDEFKGSALRGAWQAHLRTLYCAQKDSTDPLHQSICPVCFMLSRESHPSDNRRPYAFEPPLTRQTTFEPGETFTFGLSIFGSAIQFLPYIILAIQQMGREQGIGHPHHKGGRRGTFELHSIDELAPFSSIQYHLYQAGHPVLTPPSHPVTNQEITARVRELLAQLSTTGNQISLHFLTPTRIIHQEKLSHHPAFVPLFARILDRVSMLAHQFSSAEPLPLQGKGELLNAAQNAHLVADHTTWWDVKGYSSRLGRSQPIGGFIGQAVYYCDDWSPLLPWLLWGTQAHVGKNAVKGNGWYQLEAAKS